MSQLSLIPTRKPFAIFSDCVHHPRCPDAACIGRPYRYLLGWPTGIDNDSILLFCGANPSKAGRIVDGVMSSDPTISRMRNLALTMGFGWVWAVNARSYVSTDPSGVPPDPEGIGPATDEWIAKASRDATLVLCAYGHLAGTRAPRVLQLIRQTGKIPHALALAADGTPRHPRGVPSSAKPFPLEEARKGPVSNG